MNQQSGGNPNTTTCSNCGQPVPAGARFCMQDRKSTRLNSSHGYISYAVFCLKKKKIDTQTRPAHNSATQRDCPNGHSSPHASIALPYTSKTTESHIQMSCPA